MSDAGAGRTIELRYELDAPPGKVWRAVTMPELRERWLPGEDLAGAEAVEVTPGRDVTYRMRDGALESTVTFHVEPGLAGRTRLRVVHRLADPSAARRPANGNAALMRAA